MLKRQPVLHDHQKLVTQLAKDRIRGMLTILEQSDLSVKNLRDGAV